MKKQILSILLVEDDPYFSHQVSKVASEFGLIDIANLEEMALNKIEHNNYDLAIIDLNLTKGDESKTEGLTILKKAKSKGIYSIILSSNENDQITKQVYSIGANHFLRKSNFKESLRPYIQHFLRFKDKDNWTKFFSENFVSQDQKLLQNIRNLASSNLSNQSIFLAGETGVGKTLLAKLIHQMTSDNDHFIHLNCSEIPSTLIESELFGFKKGAFTGADKSKKGLLELANGGTLFLDEIATMPIYTQQKLLKAIDEKTFTPLGSETPISVDFTLISATCEDLQAKIKNKEFREDFYFRISGFEIFIPPLRQRKEDVKLQIFHYLSKSQRKFFLEQEVLDALIEYHWPGNSRELAKTINSLSLSGLGIIDLENPILKKILNKSTLQDHNLLTKNQEDYIQKIGLKNFIREVELDVVQKTLARNQQKVAKTIKDLKISNSHYYRILQEENKS